MNDDPNSMQSLFGQINLNQPMDFPTENDAQNEVVDLLKQVATGQQRQNELLEELVHHLGSAQRQRANEMGQWKQANPHLADSCRAAAEALGRAQTQFLEKLTEDITDNEEYLLEGDFILNELVDRYGPRLAHLNGVLQVLSQLSRLPTSTTTQQQ